MVSAADGRVQPPERRTPGTYVKARYTSERLRLRPCDSFRSALDQATGDVAEPARWTRGQVWQRVPWRACVPEARARRVFAQRLPKRTSFIHADINEPEVFTRMPTTGGSVVRQLHQNARTIDHAGQVEAACSERPAQRAWHIGRKWLTGWMGGTTHNCRD